MTYNSEVTGKIILELRKSKKWSRAVLAEKMGISEKQIYLYEIGDTIPPMDRLFDLCELFDCELGYLLGEESYKEGTRLNTAICESLGISGKAVESLRAATHRGLSQELAERQQTISRFFESPFLGEFFDCLVDAVSVSDQLTTAGETEYDNLVDRYGEEIAEKAYIYLLLSPIDEIAVENRNETELQEAVKELNVSKDLRRNDEFALKVAKYELREAFETLVRNIL